MNVATARTEVGVRDLKNNLSRYLERVRGGEVVIVTDRGRPVARLAGLDGPADMLEHLIDIGAARRPRATTRRRPAERIVSTRPVSDLVADQRR